MSPTKRPIALPCITLENGYLEVAKLLLAAGADTTQKEYLGRTALNLAKIEQHPKLVTPLSKHSKISEKASTEATSSMLCTAPQSHQSQAVNLGAGAGAGADCEYEIASRNTI